VRVAYARSTAGLGLKLLGIWLVLHGILSLTTFAIPGLPLLMAVLALAAGLMILTGR
jgi:hypothetical protein